MISFISYHKETYNIILEVIKEIKYYVFLERKRVLFLFPEKVSIFVIIIDIVL
jgi:hypothetical protein